MRVPVIYSFQLTHVSSEMKNKGDTIAWIAVYHDIVLQPTGQQSVCGPSHSPPPK